MGFKGILLFDANPTIVGVLETALNISYKVFRASHLDRAISLVEKQRIGLAIVSHHLPNLDGLDILQALKRGFPRLPVVFVAEAPTDDLIISAFRSGASDFLKAPVNRDDFINCIGRFINHSSSPKAWLRRLQALTSGWLTTFFKTVVRNGHVEPFVNDADLAMQPEPLSSTNPEPACCNSSHEEQQIEDAGPRLQASFLGCFKVALNGHVIDKWPSRKAKTIFAYLVFNHKRRVCRDILIDKFWPDADPGSARNCLNVALSSIRRLLNRIDPANEHILFKDDCYFLNPEIEIELDIEEFMHHWKLAQSREREQKIEAAVAAYERATALYAGDFIEEDIYESWSTSERESLREIYLVILDRLSKHYSMNGKPDGAIRLCEKILEKDNCREEIHRRIMRCYYRLGQRDKAIRQFDKCKKILQAELEVEPTGATIKLYEQIKQNIRLNGKKKKNFSEI